MEHQGGLVSRIWSGILKIVGVRFEHQWSAQEYLVFLEGQGWKVSFSHEMEARISLLYVECRSS